MPAFRRRATSSVFLWDRKRFSRVSRASGEQLPHGSRSGRGCSPAGCSAGGCWGPPGGGDTRGRSASASVSCWRRLLQVPQRSETGQAWESIATVAKVMCSAPGALAHRGPRNRASTGRRKKGSTRFRLPGLGRTDRRQHARSRRPRAPPATPPGRLRREMRPAP